MNQGFESRRLLLYKLQGVKLSHVSLTVGCDRRGSKVTWTSDDLYSVLGGEVRSKDVVKHISA